MFTLIAASKYELNVIGYVDKGGYSSNSNIVSAELLPLMAKYTLPFSTSVKQIKKV